MKKLFLNLLLLLAITIVSCDKQTDPATSILTDNQEKYIEDDAAAVSETEAVEYETDYFTSSSTVITSLSGQTKNTTGFWQRYINSVGPAVTIDPIGDNWPKTITINYGNGIELVNGRVIQGIIQVVVSAPPRTLNSTRTVTFKNFYIDSAQITGTMLKTYTATDSSEIKWKTAGTVSVLFTDSTKVTREINQIKLMVDGFDTPFDHSDDVFNITGTVTTTYDSKTIVRQIVDPLVKLGDCRYIVQGIVSLAVDGDVFCELDYGNGTCDDIATITKDGKTIQITIGKRKHRKPLN